MLVRCCTCDCLLACMQIGNIIFDFLDCPFEIFVHCSSLSCLEGFTVGQKQR